MTGSILVFHIFSFVSNEMDGVMAEAIRLPSDERKGTDVVGNNIVL